MESEGDVVVEAVHVRWGRLLGTLAGATGAAAGTTTVVARSATALITLVGGTTPFVTATTATAATVEHLHLIGDDFGRIAFDAVLLPGIGTEAALDIELGALFHIFCDDLSQFLVEHHAMPFSALLVLAGILVFPGLGSGQRHVGDRPTTGHVTGFRVLADIAHQYHFVDASACHVFLRLPVAGLLSLVAVLGMPQV